MDFASRAPQRCCKSEKRASHAGWEAQKKTSATQGENAICDFYETVAARTRIFMILKMTSEPPVPLLLLLNFRLRTRTDFNRAVLSLSRGQHDENRNSSETISESHIFESSRESRGGAQNLGTSATQGENVKNEELHQEI